MGSGPLGQHLRVFHGRLMEQVGRSLPLVGQPGLCRS